MVDVSLSDQKEPLRRKYNLSHCTHIELHDNSLHVVDVLGN